MTDVVRLVLQVKAELEKAGDCRRSAERIDPGPIRASLIEVTKSHERKALDLIREARALHRDGAPERTVRMTKDLRLLMEEIDARMIAVEALLRRLRS